MFNGQLDNDFFSAAWDYTIDYLKDYEGSFDDILDLFINIGYI